MKKPKPKFRAGQVVVGHGGGIFKLKGKPFRLDDGDYRWSVYHSTFPVFESELRPLNKRERGAGK